MLDDEEKGLDDIEVEVGGDWRKLEQSVTFNEGGMQNIKPIEKSYDQTSVGINEDPLVKRDGTLGKGNLGSLDLDDFA